MVLVEVMALPLLVMVVAATGQGEVVGNVKVIGTVTAGISIFRDVIVVIAAKKRDRRSTACKAKVKGQAVEGVVVVVADGSRAVLRNAGRVTGTVSVAIITSLSATVAIAVTNRNPSRGYMVW